MCDKLYYFLSVSVTVNTIIIILGIIIISILTITIITTITTAIISIPPLLTINKADVFLHRTRKQTTS